MPCYRQERYVRSALASVLAQDYSPLEIVVADDASPDGTLDAILATVQDYSGPHRVKVVKGRSNLGIGVYQTLADAAEGALLVECHSDDLAYPTRVSRLVEAWQRHDASLITSNAIVIDAEGRRSGPFFSPQPRYPTDALDVARDGWKPWLLGATFAYPRDLIAGFPPLSRKRAPIEVDWILPFRASLMRGIAVVDEPLIDYRVHASNATAAATARETDDVRVKSEAGSAQRLGQLVYMLETITTPPGAALAGARLTEIRQTVLSSVVRAAFHWSTNRHALRSAGFKLRWLPPD